MFCPLCRTEYRAEVGACASCGATLQIDDVQFPKRMVWQVDDRETSRNVLQALQQAGIPVRHRALYDHWVHALLLRRPQFEVWILKSDEGRARAALVQMQKPPEFQDEAPDVRERPRQFCPFCNGENPEGYQACSGCGIDLTTWREEPLDPTGEPPVLLWKGGEPVALSRIVDCLQKEGMPFHLHPTAEHFVFRLALARPRWEIYVYQSDAERAFDLIADIHDSFPFVDSREGGDTPEPAAPDAASGEAAPATFNPAVATAEAWTGTDPGLAQALRLAWRENGIESWTVEDDGGTQHLWIDAIHRERAAQITREVTGASVPFAT